jgi:hypothetical protein
VREEKGSGCEGGNVFDLFAVVLRQRLRREVMSAKQSNGKKKKCDKGDDGTREKLYSCHKPVACG